MSLAALGKRASLACFKAAGLFGRIGRSAWRRQRLLILCHHGISMADEHEWDPALYMPPERLATRLEALRKANCTVLPLAEALERLYAGDLPDRSVALTFDDGYYDFQSLAFPRLRAYGFPVTVYLSTLRCGRNTPSFGLVCSYMLWKSRGRLVDHGGLLETREPLDLRTEPGRHEAQKGLVRHVARMTATQKDAVAEALARRLEFDYDTLQARRILHVMNPDEVSAMARQGVDFQLHTHSHNTRRDEEGFRREIRTNRDRLVEMTGRVPTHFCYPSGVYRPECLPWLADEGVVSATTCDRGYASSDVHPLLLPRMVDTTLLSALEFEAWITGGASLLPRREAS